jgi:glycosyltransferase involved in cell wall biosynthesis
MEKLGQGLAELGHEVEFLSTSNLPSIALLFLSKSTVLLRRLSRSWLWLICHLYFSRLMLGLLVWRAHKESRYDIIHTQDPTAYASTSLVRMLTRIPVLLTVHGYFVHESVAGRAKKGSFIWDFLQHWEASASRSARTVFTVDQGIMRYLVGLGLDQQNVTVMRNFVDVDEFSPEAPPEDSRREFGLPMDKFIILCPRRLAKKCGVVYAAYAAREFTESWGPDFLLVYAGEGPEKGNILSFAEKNDLSRNITLLGNVPHKQMARLLRGADVVVIPSISVGVEKEATSISALESMASGVPVIASNIGGLKELIQDDQTGYLVPEKDPKALAKALKRAATESQERVTKEARDLVIRKYSHLIRAEEFLAFYRRASQR